MAVLAGILAVILVRSQASTNPESLQPELATANQAMLVVAKHEPAGEVPVSEAADLPESRGSAQEVIETESAAPPGIAESPAKTNEPQGYLPGVNREYLATVRDDTVFRAAEANAWFHLLDLLEKTDERTLRSASLGQVGFLQLDRQASAYRGRIVTVSGTVRAAKLLEAPANEYGIKQYYQLWLQPNRDAEELLVIYALHLPPGFPLDDELDLSATCTGFFFKRWAYPSRSGVMTAPLLLARTLAWQQVSDTPVPVASDDRMFFSVVAAGILALLVVVVVVVRSRRPRRRVLPESEQIAISISDAASDETL